MIWVMSDVHGCIEEFKELVAKLKLGPMDILFILGDLVDRGPDPIGCVKYARSIPNVVITKGNHEHMMLTDERLWLYNGGECTRNQLLSLPEVERLEILDWAEKLPIWLNVQVKSTKYLLVHAGLNCHNRVKGEHLKHLINDSDRQTGPYGEDSRIWIREEFMQAPALTSYITVFGHSPTHRIPTWRKPKIWYGHPSCVAKPTKSKIDKIGIDCGCYYGGNLAALCLDNMKEVYVKSLA